MVLLNFNHYAYVKREKLQNGEGKESKGFCGGSYGKPILF